jgi:hypothetical protein
MGKQRSPNYPATGLTEAIDLARRLWKIEQRTSVSPDVIAKAWGYKSLSGPVRTKVSAMKKYGLLEQTTDGMRLSQRAVQIVNYKADTQEYQEAMQAAAKEPELFQELYKTHQNASDDALRAYLVTKKAFSDPGARQLIKAFRETMAVAKLQDSPYTPHDGNGSGNKLVVGDTVQWESQGIFQFQTPLKIKGFSDDRTHAFVEGTPAGIPVNQLVKVEAETLGQSTQGSGLKDLPKSGVRREVFALDNGEAILQWPAQLTADGVAELKDWLTLVIRKVERISKAEPKAE